MKDKQIYFEKANESHVNLIFSWLSKPHMKAFWDNSQEHKDDILNFIRGEKQHYFSGTTAYFIAAIDNQPYAFLLADKLEISEDLPALHRQHVSRTGDTIAIDVGIGNILYLGKGLAAKTITAFIKFYKKVINPKIDLCIIDPSEKNSRAIHVYIKAGFVSVGRFSPVQGGFIGEPHILMKQAV